MIREKLIEKYLIKQVEARGGKALKFVSPGTPGVPDRIIFVHGETLFVETKAPGGALRPSQVRTIAMLRGLGQSVAVLDSKDAVDRWISSVERFANSNVGGVA